jgi:hypothetical protein
VFVPAYLAACHAELGAFAEGTSMANSGLEIAEAVDHPMSRAFAAWGADLVALRQGKLSRAASVLERVVNACQVIERFRLIARSALHRTDHLLNADG